MLLNSNNNDNVNHPYHYSKIGKYEPIDVIEDWGLGFCLGNTVKYIARAGHKQDFEGQDQKAKTLEDLKKASWYLNRFIQNLESGNTD